MKFNAFNASDLYIESLKKKWHTLINYFVIKIFSLTSVKRIYVMKTLLNIHFSLHCMLLLYSARKLIYCMFVTACADPENISRGCPRDNFVFQCWRGVLRPISGILLYNLFNLISQEVEGIVHAPPSRSAHERVWSFCWTKTTNCIKHAYLHIFYNQVEQKLLFKIPQMTLMIS